MSSSQQEFGVSSSYSIRRVVPGTESAEVPETVFRSFYEPTPYALYTWVAQASKEKEIDGVPAVKLATKYFTKCLMQMVRGSNESMILEARDKKNNDPNSPILGCALVIYQYAFSSNKIINSVQKFYRGVVLGMLGLMKAGMPPKGLIGRFSAMGTMDEARHRATKNRAHLHLIILACLPENRGKGVGGALLTALSKYADERGEEIYLETDEPHLRTYYEGYGFVCQEEYVLKDGDDVFSPNYAMLRPVKNVVKY